MSSPSGVRGGAQAENGLISADRLCSQQVTANSSPFRPEKWGTRAAQQMGVGTMSPHFWDQRSTGGTESNENDLCFYIRQSLFSKVQVTEFQVSTPLTLVDTCQVKDILGRVSTVHPAGLLHCSNLHANMLTQQ